MSLPLSNLPTSRKPTTNSGTTTNAPHAKNIGSTSSTVATSSYLKMYVSEKAHSLPHSSGLNSHNNTSLKSLETIGKTNTISGTAPPAPVTYWQGLLTNTISGQVPSILPMLT